MFRIAKIRIFRVFSVLTWPVSIQLSEVVEHETEETGELKKEEKKNMFKLYDASEN